ncbi:MAG: universal stress protein [Deltaproteobacteria bacterium]|nr:universal stress protein [Deltaproteobacteria bacterium]
MAIQKKMLILVDGSERTIQTVNYVKDFMPVDENTRIVLFHVYSGIQEEYRELEQEPTCITVADQLKNRETQEKGKIRACLEQAKNILISGGFSEQSIEIKFHRLEKGVARDIIEEARKGYTAVVLRRRGMGALKNIILGSVAVKLLQALTFIPILIVGQAPAVKKILLAVDASPASMKAVEFVASLLGGHGYEVCIFHAIPGLGAIHFDLSEVCRPELPEVDMSDTCLEAFKLKVARLFQDVKHRLVTSGFESEKISEKIISGVRSRSDAIVKEAEKGGFGTIAVGRRGLSKVEAFFMGRVGHEVVYGGKIFTVWVV